MEGKSINDICDHLNERQIPTPAEFIMDKKNDDPRTFQLKCKELRWDKSRIYRILKNYAYTGTAVLGNKRRLSIGSRSSKKVAPNDLFFIENDHPAIVTKEEYEKALEIIKSLKKPGIKAPLNRPLTGKMVCGNCGLKMLYTGGSYEKIYCTHGVSVGKYSECRKEAYDAKKIEAYVFYYLKQQINLIIELSQKSRDKRDGEKTLYDSEIKKANLLIKSMDEERIRLYEQYANGYLSKEKYVVQKEDLNEEKKKQQERLDSIESERKEDDDFIFEAERMNNRLSRIKSDRRITREIVDAYIESVTINGPEEIEIEFKFEDVVAKKLADCRAG